MIALRCGRMPGEGSLPVRHSLLSAGLILQALATSDPRDLLLTSRARVLIADENTPLYCGTPSRRAGTRALPAGG